jgi:hypothetical protein
MPRGGEMVGWYVLMPYICCEAISPRHLWRKPERKKTARRNRGGEISQPSQAPHSVHPSQAVLGTAPRIGCRRPHLAGVHHRPISEGCTGHSSLAWAPEPLPPPRLHGSHHRCPRMPRLFAAADVAGSPPSLAAKVRVRRRS